MKNIFLLALATALTVGQAAYATGKPHQKACKDCKEKVCTPACKDHCGQGCCAKH